MIKRRGKSGLLGLNKTWPECREWIGEKALKNQKVEHVEGVLTNFLVEPFVPHPADTEYYININSVREVRSILTSPELLHNGTNEKRRKKTREERRVLRAEVTFSSDLLKLGSDEVSLRPPGLTMFRQVVGRGILFFLNGRGYPGAAERRAKG